MGKGDRRSRRGKLFRGSHGKRRPDRIKKAKPGGGPRAETRPKTPAS